MADKKIDIAIKTTADTTGATQAQKAVGKLADEGKRVGDNYGKKGNAATAILEMSRGLEDLQYGIRGVLNNIPSLVFALGGGAGLAGVISIAAVAGSQLYSLLSKGSEDAKKETIDYLEIFKKLSKEFGNAAEKVEKMRGDSIEKNAETRKRAGAEDLRAGEAALKLDQQRVKNDGTVAVAQARLEMLRLEQKMATETGEKAIQLAKEHEAIQKNIVAMEERKVELMRQAEESAAQKKVSAAKGNLDAASSTEEWARDRRDTRNREAGQIDQQLAAATAQRTSSIQSMIAERDAARVQYGKTSNPLEAMALEQFITDLGKAIENAFKNPSESESLLTVQSDEAKVATKLANDNLTKASEDQKAAADELQKAAAALANLRESQSAERGLESQMKGIGKETEAINKKNKSEDVTVKGINQLVESVGTGGGADLQKAAQELAQMASDNIISAQELERSNLLLAQFGAQIQRFGQAQNTALQDAISKVNQLTRDVANLKLNSSPAPR